MDMAEPFLTDPDVQRGVILAEHARLMDRYGEHSQEVAYYEQVYAELPDVMRTSRLLRRALTTR